VLSEHRRGPDWRHRGT